MGTTATPNLGLIKPDSTEPAQNWPAQVGSNYDTIDDAVIRAAAKIIQTSSQSIPNNAITQLNMNTAAFDNDGMANLANNRLVIQTAGIYLLIAGVRWSPGTGVRVTIEIQVNGSSVATDGRQAPVGNNGMITETTEELSQGDLITANCFQVSGGSVSTAVGSSNMPFLSAAMMSL